MEKSKTGTEAREALSAESSIKHLNGKRKLIPSAVGLPSSAGLCTEKGMSLELSSSKAYNSFRER